MVQYKCTPQTWEPLCAQSCQSCQNPSHTEWPWPPTEDKYKEKHLYIFSVCDINIVECGIVPQADIKQLYLKHVNKQSTFWSWECEGYFSWSAISRYWQRFKRPWGSLQCCVCYLGDLLLDLLQFVRLVGPQKFGLGLSLLLQSTLSVLPSLPRPHALVKTALWTSSLKSSEVDEY